MNVSTNDIFTVITLYNVCLEQSVAYKSLTVSLKEHFQGNIAKKQSLLVYDNSKYIQPISESCYWNIIYVHDPSNPGVSKAYNTGAGMALSQKKKWLLIVDQDSDFPASTYTTIQTSLGNYPNIKLFAPILKSSNGIISPCIYKFKRGFAPKSIQPGVVSLHKYSPVNSGLTIALDLFNEVSGYNEKIRLDFSDFYFIDKVKENIDSFVIMNLYCEHSLSGEDMAESAANVNRFRTYCQGARLSVNSYQDYFTLFIITLLRACKLTLKSRNIVFLLIFFKCYILRTRAF